MYRVDAELADDRKEYRRDDERDDRRLHEHAAYRKQYDYAPEQDYAAVGEADERFRENRGQLVVDDAVAEDSREGENHRDDGEVLDAVDYAGLELVPRELLIDEGSDGEGVEDSERAGLRRGHDAEAYERYQYEREEQRPDAFPARLEYHAERIGLVVIRLVAEAARRPRGRDQHEYAHDDARHEARDEEASDGDLADRSVYDEPHRRRNRRDDEPREAVDRGGPSGGVAALRHFGAEDAAFHSRVGDRRARDAAHERGEDDGDLPDRAVHVAGQDVRELDEARGDARVVHKVAREDEERYREHRKGLRRGERLLDENRPRNLRRKDEEYRAGDGYRESDGHPEEEEYEEETYRL